MTYIKKRRARIIKYYQVVDDHNFAIDNAHSLFEARKIKKEWEKLENVS